MKERKQNIKGKRFKKVKQNFQGVQAGHRLHQKMLILLLGAVFVGICSSLASLSALFLSSILEENSFYGSLTQFEVLLSCFEVVTYVVTLLSTAYFGLEIKFVAYLACAIALSVIATTLPQGQNIGVSAILFSLSLSALWSSSIGVAIAIVFITTACGKAYEFITVAIAALLTVVMIIEVFSNSNPITTISGLAVVATASVVAKRTFNEASGFVWLKEKAAFWAASGATSFYNLNLTDVQFDHSDLSYADLRKTVLTRTSFYDVKGLNLARVQGTILEDPRVRELVISRNGIGQDFTDANLQGANLQEAKLQESVLVRAQLLDADLSYANLTDACIQDWNINHNTRFTGVECKRVYLKRSPNGHFLEPKPDSGEFLPGEFEKWVTDIRDTIDLIFQNGLNWRAFAFSLTQTAIDHNGLDLAVRSIENKGDGVVVAKVGVSLETNKKTIHRQMTGHYQEAMGAIEAGYELALKAKNEEIDRLTQFYDNQQKFIQGLVTGIAETKGQVLIQGEGNRVYLMDQAGDIMESNQNVNAGGNVDMSSDARVSIGGDMSGSTVNLGDLSGQVSQTIQQLHDIKTGETQELAQILKQLQQAIETDTALTPDQKQQALEAVSTLAEEGNKPPEQRTAKFCTMAVNALKGLTSTLTDASKLAEAAKLLLPTLTGIFGL